MRRIATIGRLLIFAFLATILATCNLLRSDTPEHPSFITGSISGTARFTTSNGLAASGPIKMAAFYRKYSSFLYDNLCTNVVTLGTAPNVDKSFTLSFDFHYGAFSGDYVEIVAWKDTNGDNLKGSGELEERITTYNIGGTCQVFGDEYFAGKILYYDYPYDDPSYESRGWYIYSGVLDKYRFNDQQLTGARLTTKYSFY